MAANSIELMSNSQRLITGFTYRPEIDGLRALAVLAVVFFHAGLGIPGGFVGVDVFFVISGYLISSLILKDLQAGRFSMLDFWERRARRIIPAATVLVLAVLLAGWFLLLPSDYERLAKSAISQVIFAANYYFFRNIDYFSGNADELPLLHMWSLAVEEQFYIFLPPILFALYRTRVFRQRKLLLVVMALAFVVSLILSVIQISQTPSKAFYLLPARAWELIAGSLVALLAPVWVPKGRIIREVMATIGLSMVVISFWLISEEAPFPGLAAIAPCGGSALFILASQEVDGLKPRVARLLSVRPIVFLGLISYSLYLWHWPIIAYSNYWALGPIGMHHRLILVGTSLVLAVLSWRYVETPFRVRRIGTNRTIMFRYAGVGMSLVTVFAFSILITNGWTFRFSERALAYDETRREGNLESSLVPPMGQNELISGDFPRLGESSPAPIELLVWGDSHARAILPALESIANSGSSSIAVAWYPQTPPVLGFIPEFPYSLGEQAPQYARAVVEYAVKQRIPNVLLVARWSGYPGLGSNSAWGVDQVAPETGLTKPLVNTVRELTSNGIVVWILIEVPSHMAPVPKVLLAKEVFSSNIDAFIANKDSVKSRNSPMIHLAPRLIEAGAQLIDLAPILWDFESKRYSIEREEKALYYDRHHLSKFGASQLSEGLSKILAP